jgi:hypothetical protein
MKGNILLFLTIIMLTAALSWAASARTQEPVFKDLPGAGRKCWIDETRYFTWEFDKSPKIGTVVLVVRLFDRNGKRLNDMQITGRTDMPSMRGAHDSGDVAFKLNRAGNYLLPVDIVMLGKWEVRLTISRGGTPVFFGRIIFDV